MAIPARDLKARAPKKAGDKAVAKNSFQIGGPGFGAFGPIKKSGIGVARSSRRPVTDQEIEEAVESFAVEAKRVSRIAADMASAKEARGDEIEEIFEEMRHAMSLVAPNQ